MEGAVSRPVLPCGLATGLLALAAGGALIVYNRLGGSPAALLSAPKDLAVSGLLVLVLLGALGLLRHAARTADRAMFLRALAGSVALVAGLLLAAEMTLRALAVPTPLGLRVGELDLRPLDWAAARASSTRWLGRATTGPGVLDAADPDLGWDLGRARQTPDGLYAVNAAGIRSPTATTAETAAPELSVALVGDSFTFGEEVAFADTWGEALARRLPAGTSVANFGVPAHGLDQTLLKLRRDVLPRRPDVVILGFLGASPLRTTSVYLFLQPDLELPWSKPRFLLEEGNLRLLNSPPEAAAAILARPTVWDLPLLRLDSGFEAPQWERPPLAGSFVARYLVSRFPRWSPRRQRFPDDDIVALTARLLEVVDADVRAAGAVPVLVSLPVLADLTGGAGGYRDRVVAALAAAGIEVLDVAPCLLARLPPEQLFLGPGERRTHQAEPGPAHYSPRGNEAVATCLAPVVLASAESGAD